MTKCIQYSERLLECEPQPKQAAAFHNTTVHCKCLKVEVQPNLEATMPQKMLYTVLVRRTCALPC